MKDFDYVIVGGGCAGLSLAYELEINDKLKNKSLAIIDHRTNYNRDKTWSFWKVNPHNFEDCVIKSWDVFSINISGKTNYVNCTNTPYQSIDSGLFYKKIIAKLEKNKNINFFKTINGLNLSESIIFNSLPNLQLRKNNLWQHFGGIEIEVKKRVFDTEIMNLMDFDCDQKNSVHFFYTLPYSENRALIESTWLSNMLDETEKNYEEQLKNYIEKNLNVKNYKILYEEKGKIPLFYPHIIKKKNEISIGTAGCMTRLSTGYTFLNIQDHSKYICKNLENIDKVKSFEIEKKYKYMDKIFLKVLSKHPERMPEIFYNLFKANNKKVIKFLSNKSNIIDDINIILKMPKIIFIKELI
tara:strand:- start:351 stop:1415 length:1065 start_codon:yes stop_codon:yes gene_type:complete